MPIVRRVTPDDILELKENEVYVFPTSLSGKHVNIYAVLAQLRFGARYGKAFGWQGKTYAIPTIDETMRNKLPLAKIERYLGKLYDEASRARGRIFYIAGFGCGGIGSWPAFAIAPLFKELAKLDNVYLPEKIWDCLGAAENES